MGEHAYARSECLRILGLGQTATAQEIHRAYRQFALAFHPDLHGSDPIGRKRFVEIGAAYHRLREIGALDAERISIDRVPPHLIPQAVTAAPAHSLRHSVHSEAAVATAVTAVVVAVLMGLVSYVLAHDRMKREFESEVAMRGYRSPDYGERLDQIKYDAAGVATGVVCLIGFGAFGFGFIAHRSRRQRRHAALRAPATTDKRGRQHIPPPSRLARAGALAFPVVLLLFATLPHLTRPGERLDGSRTHSSDFAAGERGLELRPLFYRPLHLVFAHQAQPLLRNHDLAGRLISAGCHGLVVLMLWWFLRARIRTGLAAAIAAIAFMVHPLHYEVIFSPSAASTGIAVATFLLLAMMYVRYVRTGGGPGLLWLTALAFASILCWNEQPAAGMIALPLLGWGVASRRIAIEERLRRCLAPIVLGAVAVALYIVLVQSTAPESSPGSGSSPVAQTDLPTRIAVLVEQVPEKLAGAWTSQALPGTTRQTLTAIAEPGFMVWAAALLLTAGLWLVRWVGRDLNPRSETSASCQPAAVFSFGLLVFVIAWPAALLLGTQTIEPRACYFPLLGLTIAAAVLIDQLVVWFSTRRVPRALFRLGSGAVLLAWAFPSALALVGDQDMLRDRYRFDQHRTERPHTLAPGAPAEVLRVRFRIEEGPIRIGFGSLDLPAVEALGHGSATAIIDRTYPGDDPHGNAYPWRQPQPTVGHTPTFLRPANDDRTLDIGNSPPRHPGERESE